MFSFDEFCDLKYRIRFGDIAELREDYKLDEESMQIVLKLKHAWEEMDELLLDGYWSDECYTENRFRDRMSLAATSTKMMDNGLFKAYAKHCPPLFNRPYYISGGSIGLHADRINSPLGQLVPAVVNQEKWKDYNGGKLDREKGLAHTQNWIPHSYGEWFSSHSEAPHDLSSDGLVVDRLRALEFDVPALKNKVSTNISKYGKNAFYVSDGSHQQMKELISAGSNGLHVDWINSPLRQHVSIDIPSVVNQQGKEYIGNELDRNKRDYSLITKSTLAITTSAAGGKLLNTSISGTSDTSWIGNFVAVATVIGFAFTMASIGLRRVKPMLSGIMIKLGAVSAASAIILALGSTVPPAVGWPAGVVAWLLIAIGVAMA